jgi:hypothetical protein
MYSGFTKLDVWPAGGGIAGMIVSVAMVAI